MSTLLHPKGRNSSILGQKQSAPTPTPGRERVRQANPTDRDREARCTHARRGRRSLQLPSCSRLGSSLHRAAPPPLWARRARTPRSLVGWVSSRRSRPHTHRCLYSPARRSWPRSQPAGSFPLAVPLSAGPADARQRKSQRVRLRPSRTTTWPASGCGV